MGRMSREQCRTLDYLLVFFGGHLLRMINGSMLTTARTSMIDAELPEMSQDIVPSHSH